MKKIYEKIKKMYEELGEFINAKDFVNAEIMEFKIEIELVDLKHEIEKMND